MQPISVTIVPPKKRRAPKLPKVQERVVPAAAAAVVPAVVAPVVVPVLEPAVVAPVVPAVPVLEPAVVPAVVAPVVVPVLEPAVVAPVVPAVPVLEPAVVAPVVPAVVAPIVPLEPAVAVVSPVPAVPVLEPAVVSPVVPVLEPAAAVDGSWANAWAQSFYRVIMKQFHIQDYECMALLNGLESVLMSNQTDIQHIQTSSNVKVKLPNKPRVPKTNDVQFCTICKIYISSKRFNNHCATDSHTRKEKKTNIEKWQCTVCNVTLLSSRRESHEQSKTHTMKTSKYLRAGVNLTDTSSTSTPSSTQSPIPRAADAAVPLSPPPMMQCVNCLNHATWNDTYCKQHAQDKLVNWWTGISTTYPAAKYKHFEYKSDDGYDEHEDRITITYHTLPTIEDHKLIMQQLGRDSVPVISCTKLNKTYNILYDGDCVLLRVRFHCSEDEFGELYRELQTYVMADPTVAVWEELESVVDSVDSDSVDSEE